MTIFQIKKKKKSDLILNIAQSESELMQNQITGI